MVYLLLLKMFHLFCKRLSQKWNSVVKEKVYALYQCVSELKGLNVINNKRPSSVDHFFFNFDVIITDEWKSRQTMCLIEKSSEINYSDLLSKLAMSDLFLLVHFLEITLITLYYEITTFFSDNRIKWLGMLYFSVWNQTLRYTVNKITECACMFPLKVSNTDCVPHLRRI